MFNSLTNEEICKVCAEKLFTEFDETCVRLSKRCLLLRDCRDIAQAQTVKDAKALWFSSDFAQLDVVLGGCTMMTTYLTLEEYEALKKLGRGIDENNH